MPDAPGGQPVCVAVGGIASCRFSGCVEPGMRLAVGDEQGVLRPSCDCGGMAVALSANGPAQLTRWLTGAPRRSRAPSGGS